MSTNAVVVWRTVMLSCGICVDNLRVTAADTAKHDSRRSIDAHVDFAYVRERSGHTNR
jgi:hypothetical protein